MHYETIRNETLREEVQHTTLAGDLPIFFCPKTGFQKKYACYATHYGSVDSVFRPPGASKTDAPVEVPDGIAHFLEHTLFETANGNVSDLFAKNGAYNNAATSFSTTTYLFASSDRFFDNLKLLIDFVENPVFDPAKVEKEKGIIEQEILRYKDDPGWVGYMGLLESLFEKHPLRIDIAGTAESIRKIDSESLHRCYRTFYSPRNMILFVTGDLDRDEVFEFVATQSRHGQPRDGSSGADGEKAEDSEIERIYPDEPAEVVSEDFEERMEVALPKLLLGYKEVGVPVDGRELLIHDFTTEFALDILFGRGSDVFMQLYASQLILDDFSAYFYSCAGVGFVILGGETPDPSALRQALEKIISEVRDRPFAAEDFEREKRKFIGGFIRGFNSLEFIASHYTYYRFHDLDLFDTIDVLESIRQEDVEQRVQTLFDSSRQACARILPRK